MSCTNYLHLADVYIYIYIYMNLCVCVCVCVCVWSVALDVWGYLGGSQTRCFLGVVGGPLELQC